MLHVSIFDGLRFTVCCMLAHFGSYTTHMHVCMRSLFGIIMNHPICHVVPHIVRLIVVLPTHACAPCVTNASGTNSFEVKAFINLLSVTPVIIHPPTHHHHHHLLKSIIPTPSSSVSPIFHPTLTVHSHLSPMKRSAIVTLTRAGKKKQEISQLLQVTLPTIRKWNKQFDTNHDVEDRPRSGRRRTLNEVTVRVERRRTRALSSVQQPTKAVEKETLYSVFVSRSRQGESTTDSHGVFIIIFVSIGCVC